MASNRHEQLGRELTSKLDAALDRLRYVWDEIGLSAEQRRTRQEVVVVHLNNLLEEMVVEEEGLRDRLMKKIEKCGTDLLQLCKELDLPPYEPSESMTNIQLGKHLRLKVESLEAERRNRINQLANLQKEEQHLCDIMCATPNYIASGTVPTIEQLDELRGHIQELNSEKERRYSIFTSTKKTIMKMLDELEQCPNTSFERELICEEDDSFLLTSENMSALKQYCDELEKQQKDNFALASKLRDHMEILWERLQTHQDERVVFRTNNAGFKPKVIEKIKEEIGRCELEKLEKMQQVIENTRKELVSWWDKCYMAQTDKDEFKPFTSLGFTEHCLIQHEEEVRKVKEYYDQNKDMLDLVGKWQKLFSQFLEHERKANDPNRFSNRGCNLLKEERARKKVEKDLPKVQDDVCQKISDWENLMGKPFLVEGVPFTHYIQQQWEQYKHKKEDEKIHRHQARAKLMAEELKYGSRPAATTPGKKRPMGTGTTPGKTPTKRFRKENGTALPVSSYTTSSLSGSSTMSSEASLRRGRGTHPAPPHFPTKQGNDTTKTPTSYTPGINRTGRANHTSVFSPACMTTRSSYKTPSGGTTGLHSTRRALADRNYPSSNDTGFSQTTVSSATASGKGDTEDVSLDSVGVYAEFARGLSKNVRPNCRSSVVPSQLKPAYF